MFRKLVLLFLVLNGTARADSFDELKRKIDKTTVLSISDNSIAFIRNGEFASGTRETLLAFEQKVQSSIPAMEEWERPLIPFIAGVDEPIQIVRWKKEKAYARNIQMACVAGGATCGFLASSAIVFWPNGVIAGACAALSAYCIISNEEIIKKLDELIIAEQNLIKEKALKSSGSSGENPNPTAGERPHSSIRFRCRTVPGTYFKYSENGVEYIGVGQPPQEICQPSAA